MEAKAHYMDIALSARTRATYATGVKTFQRFCAMHCISFSGLPAQPGEEMLSYFVCHCANNLKISHATIKSYLAGIKNYYIENGLGNQLVRPDGQPMLSLELILRGIKKQSGKPKLKRLPITSEVLRRLCQVLNGKVFGVYTDALMKSACCLAFFGFLRCSEFTTEKNMFDVQTNLCLSDMSIKLGNDITEARLYLKASKTDPFRQGCVIPYFSVSDSICPVKALSEYMALRVTFGTEPNSPLLLLNNGQALTRHAFLNMLTTTCIQAGISPSGFSGHSFRIGAATTAAKHKIPDHLVQKLGRWTSDCFKTYIRTSNDTIKWAQEAMCGPR